MTSGTYDISDINNKVRLMRESIRLLEANKDMGFVLLLHICNYIDGFVRAERRNVKPQYIAYLEAHFPDLCREVGAENFYEHFRNKAVHEFAPLPPYALSDNRSMHGKYCFDEVINGHVWRVMNVDRLIDDFKSHLDWLANQQQS
jgi:hypothetical protein